MKRVQDSTIRPNLGFIIYNHLYSQDDYNFTIQKLKSDLKNYNIEPSTDDIKSEIESFESAGIVYRSHNVEHYIFTAR